MTNPRRQWLMLGTSGLVVLMALCAFAAPDVPVVAVAGEVCVLALCIALLLLPMSGSEEGMPKARVLVDGAIVGIALWAIAYQLVVVRSAAFASGDIDVLGMVSILVSLVGVGLGVAVVGRVTLTFRAPAGLVCVGLMVAAGLSLLLSTHAPLPSALTMLVALAGGASALTGLVLASHRLRTPESDTYAIVDWLSRTSTVLPSAMVAAVLVMAALLSFDGRSITSIDYVTALAFVSLLVVQQLVASRERQLLISEIESKSALFQSLVTGSAELITLHTSSGDITYASPAVYRLLGTEDKMLEGADLADFLHPDDVPLLRDAQRDALVDAETVECIVRFQCATGAAELPTWRWMHTSLHNLLNNDDVRGIVANTRDIHEEHELGQRLTHEAYHDALTGLGNLAFARQIFSEHSYGRDRTPTALILLDLDGFKTLNDTFGHAFGDELLVAVARRLKRNVADEDAIARIGGDEFILIFESEREARQAARAIIDDLSRPLLVQGTSVIVRASMGIARSVDARDSEELLRNADLAMYEAKNAGGDTFVAYDERMFERTSARMRIQEGLRRALETDDFELVIQPIVDLRTRAVVGGEVLLRWTDPDLGRIAPDVFIPVAESSGLIAQIDAWVLDSACRLIRSWRDDGLKVPALNVNVSRRQITDGLDELISQSISKSGIDGNDICVEITESAVVPDPEASVRVLKAVGRLGASVALDDFGTGQSSLSQLSGLPVNRVKIDKSFVMPVASDAQAMDLLGSIVGLCQSLRLPVVAEGIEDEETAQFLVSMGAQFGQGYYFYRPMPIDDFRSLISSEVPTPRKPREDELRAGDALLADEFQVVADEEPSCADSRNE